MMMAFIIMVLVWSIPMLLYIIWKRTDWYLFVFLMIVSILICEMLSFISDVLSIIFAIFVAFYCIYNLTNKKARQIRNEIKKEREEIYNEYKKNDADNKVTFKNYILPSGNKVDYIDFNTMTFYILRPYEENVDKKYKKQIQKYQSELKAVYGGEWSGIVDTY